MTRFQDLKSVCLHRSDKDLKPKQSIVRLGGSDGAETLKIEAKDVNFTFEMPLSEIEKVRAKDLSESNNHSMDATEIFILSITSKNGGHQSLQFETREPRDKWEQCLRFLSSGGQNSLLQGKQVAVPHDRYRSIQHIALKEPEHADEFFRAEVDLGDDHVLRQICFLKLRT